MAAPVKKVPIHLQSSQNRLIIKNGKIVNATGMQDGDIFVEDGIIKQIGTNLIVPGGTRMIDARGRYIIPGGIDPHVHFAFEFMGQTSADDFYQGTKAAIAGGTTMIIDFAIPKKKESLLDQYDKYRLMADDKVCCDYALHCGITWWSDKVKQEMETLCKERGVNSFKAFMAYKDDLMIRDDELYKMMETCRQLGAVAMVHAENGDIIQENAKKLLAKGVNGPDGHEKSRPEEVEAEATNRACVISKQVNCPLYVVHVMSKEAGDVISKYREQGWPVYGEALAAGLGTDGRPCCSSNYGLAAAHIMSPPLRSDPTTKERLMDLLSADGLQTTGSDNCTFSSQQKSVGKNDFSKIPNGVNGVEDRMSVVWEKGVHTGKITPTRFVEITSTNAAKIFNLFPSKGAIAIGSDADIVVWNPNRTRTISAKTHHQACDYNIFEGMECHGVPEYVIVSGRVCVDDCELKVVQGHGRFNPTPLYPPTVYDPIASEEEKASYAALPDIVTETCEQISKTHVNGDYGDYDDSAPFNPNSAIIFSDQVSTPTGKGMRHEGVRNQQGSSFSISKEMGETAQRSTIRVHNPPGGRSSGGFW
ncbi:dihydropyrimidinase [Frankliniella occidentalis]|uniref:dihydropyrimidinase n=1 Tax=Frankliniella occidentalis TaxID=133901 RepID=A0A6J1T5E2_FRAOC|nr:dihydropyrimidinase [Frankliniella occidentalis]XP_026285846.1 dihydropyrimidinase [Frankliniella occidentalis]